MRIRLAHWGEIKSVSTCSCICQNLADRWPFNPHSSALWTGPLRFRSTKADQCDPVKLNTMSTVGFRQIFSRPKGFFFFFTVSYVRQGEGTTAFEGCLRVCASSVCADVDLLVWSPKERLQNVRYIFINVTYSLQQTMQLVFRGLTGRLLVRDLVELVLCLYNLQSAHVNKCLYNILPLAALINEACWPPKNFWSRSREEWQARLINVFSVVILFSISLIESIMAD